MSFKEHPENRNFNGRPRKGESLTDILREYLSKCDKGEKKAKQQKFIEKLVKKALDGDFNTMKYIFDRLEGTPKQTIDSNVTTKEIIVDIEEDDSNEES
jgi:hypothetical protein